MSSLHQVQALHTKFGFPRNEKPGFIDDKLMQMRLNFAFEELVELADACGFGFDGHAGGGDFSKLPYTNNATNLEDALDALIDSVYVTLGTADLMGFGSHVPREATSKWSTIWWEGWNRVHNANMLKEKGKTSRGHDIDLIKPKGWLKPQFKDLLV